MPIAPIFWFFDNGIRVFPIKPRDKEPMCKSWDDYLCSRDHLSKFINYGVALGQLAVADSDSPETEAWVAANLPDTPFKVTTGRGRHRYYRIVSSVPHFFHRAGHTIEFRNVGQYVVGPGSIHASGAVYVADSWSWRIEHVPIFPNAFQWDDRPLDQRGSADGNPLVLPPTVLAGERHDVMFKLMRSLQARGVNDLNVLLKVLHAENLIKCKPPILHDELERYIRRVSKYRDRPGFDRDDQNEFTIAGGMLEAGLSVETARVLVQAMNLGADVDTSEAEVEQPKQPKQPISIDKTDHPIKKPEVGLDTIHPNLVCQKCTHSWRQHRKTAPRRCPLCRSTVWNRPIFSLNESDDGDEIIDLNEDDDDLEIIDIDDEDVETIDEDDEDVEIIDDDE